MQLNVHTSQHAAARDSHTPHHPHGGRHDTMWKAFYPMRLTRRKHIHSNDILWLCFEFKVWLSTYLMLLCRYDLLSPIHSSCFPRCSNVSENEERRSVVCFNELKDYGILQSTTTIPKLCRLVMTILTSSPLNFISCDLRLFAGSADPIWEAPSPAIPQSFDRAPAWQEGNLVVRVKQNIVEDTRTKLASKPCLLLNYALAPISTVPMGLWPSLSMGVGRSINLLQRMYRAVRPLSHMWHLMQVLKWRPLV